MESMKAVVFYGTEDMRFETVPKPVPGPGEVCIRVKAVSICGSDLEEYRKSSDRSMPPLIFGHEFSGDVCELGEGVSKIQVGQRVTVNPILYCGECFYCKKGLINLCNNRRSVGRTLGIKKIRCDGGMADYVCVPEFAVIPLVDAVSYNQGALLEPLAVSYNAARCGGFEKGETVVVVGAGPIGLMTIQYLKAFGAGRIIVTDIVEERMNVGLQCGADVKVNVKENSVDKILALTNGIGVDRVIIAAGVPSTVQDAIKMVRNGGNIVLVGLIRHNVEINPMDLAGRQVSIHGSYMFTTEMKDAMEFIASGEIDIDPIVTSVRPLEDTPQVYQELISSNNKEVKVILTTD
jgi:2-desacetyl-2-hydroxyethyl bacteriochlorophyllide A dehydrogenase